MKIKLLSAIIFLISTCYFVYGQEQTFKLKDGTIIIGVAQEETDLSIQVQTKFGLVTIKRSELILTQYEVKLISGETLIGLKISEDMESIKLKTQVGELTIQKSNIVNIQEVGPQTTFGNTVFPSTDRHSYGLTDLLFSGMRIDKDTDFALGEEELTDLFFDPTGYTVEQSTLYLSGLSFGFGISDRFQITTQWGSFFWGNMNIRPKYKLFEKGNWENQQSLSIGAHYHSRWSSNKYEWKSIGLTNINDEVKHLGSYFKIGENPTFNIKGDSDYQYINRLDDSEEIYVEMIEFFGAYTLSKARSNLKGRISHTIGGNIQYAMIDDPLVMYRVYYGMDIDINLKLKMIGEIFYDPYFLELWQESEYDYNNLNTDKLSDNVVEQPDDYRLIHLDFGFIYALNESFRFGFHFQKPFIAFYWKL